MSPRQQSFLAFVILIAGLILGGTAYPTFPVLGTAVLIVGVVLGLSIALTIRCPRCRVFLAVARPYMAGALLLLWVVRDTCPRCGAKLFGNNSPKPGQ